jgi:peptidyl-prolyl cis-trans isomerase C
MIFKLHTPIQKLSSFQQRPESGLNSQKWISASAGITALSCKTLSTSKFFNSLQAGFLTLALLAGASSAMAQSPSEDELNEVLATVNGEEITQKDVALAVEDFSAQLAQVPPQQRLQAIVDAMIDMKVLSKEAEKEGLQDSDYFKRRLEFLRMRALRTAYLVEKVADSISEEDVKAAYDKAFADFEPQQEVKAAHILVKEEDEAKALIKQLNDGADFAELAREKSTGPSGPNGGELGWFGKGRMVPEFEQAALKLEKGEVTQAPVKTDFGWHVIKLLDTRMSEPPAYDEVKAQFRQQLLQDQFQETITRLREEASIEYKAEGLSAPSDTDEPAAPAAQ